MNTIIGIDDNGMAALTGRLPSRVNKSRFLYGLQQ